MTDLRDMQFEILPKEDKLLGGYPFGIGLDVSVNDGGWVPGESEWSVQDTVSQTRGTTLFGRDIQTAGTWSWALHTDQEEEDSALRVAGEFRSAWGAPARGHWEPGEVTTLRYRLSGRTRRIYGRPRRFSQAPSNLMISGNIPLNADFKLADYRTYDDDLSSTVISWAADGSGGMKFPLTFPIHSLPSGTDQGSILVGGNAPTYPVITFNGPVTTPTLVTDGWKLTLDTSIPSGLSVTLDLRPWHLTVIRSDGISLAGKLGRKQWLEDMFFSPGGHDIAFRGASSAGGASCLVSWRNAWSTL
jgi:hypothetical protein